MLWFILDKYTIYYYQFYYYQVFLLLVCILPGIRVDLFIEPGLGGAVGEGDGEAAAPGHQVGLEAEARADGGVLLAYGVPAGHGANYAPLDPRQVPVLGSRDAAIPYVARCFKVNQTPQVLKF